MSRLRGKKILLGVGGGIAAYKAPALVRALKQQGAEVRVVLTRAGEAFVTPMTLQVVSEERVATTLLDPAFEHEIGHIALARWADVILLAPATADLIGRMRMGLADDLLTTILLATTAPIVVAPSMNTRMLEHEAVQENLAVLRTRSRVTLVEPDAGVLACKETGAGRLPDPDVLIAALDRALHGHRMVGRRVVVTAGPTREFFDPVRFLSNPSSGKMGYSLAAAAWAAGADVTLVSGPVHLPPPHGVRVHRVVSAQEMHDAVMGHPCDVLIMAAAVADYTPNERLEHKRKKDAGPWDPSLGRTVDILATLAKHPARPPVVIGFAAETTDVLENAVRKLELKALDGIVANSVYGPTGAFGNDESTVILLSRGGHRHEFGPSPKREVADHIIEWIVERNLS